MDQGQFQTIRRIFEAALQKDAASRAEFLKARAMETKKSNAK